MLFRKKKELGTSSSGNGSGGGRSETPFREVEGSGQAVSTGAAKQGQVETSQAQVRGVGQTGLDTGQASDEPAVGETLASEEELEAYRWACGINDPKHAKRKLVDPRVEMVH